MEILSVGSPYHRVPCDIQLQRTVLGNKVPAKAAKHHLFIPPRRRNKTRTISWRKDKGYRFSPVIKRHHAHAVSQRSVFYYLSLRIHRKIHNAIIRPKRHHLAAAVASSYDVEDRT